MEIDIVTVSNNKEQYSKYFENNTIANKYKLINFDNTSENLSLPIRFNKYLDSFQDRGQWVVFCHQDFELREDLECKLKDLDKNCIYGPIGAFHEKHFTFFLKLHKFQIKKLKIGFVKRSISMGEIQEVGVNHSKKVGRRITQPTIVETLDCCCFIVHSSILKSTQYRFDTKLNWHLYSEDFSLTLKKQFNIPTKAFQLECTHYSSGRKDASFYESLEYIKNKYKDGSFVSTCYDGYWETYLHKL